MVGCIRQSEKKKSILGRGNWNYESIEAFEGTNILEVLVIDEAGVKGF